MAGIHPSGGEPASPGERLADPFAPLTTQLEDLGALLELAFEDPQQWFADLVNDVLELPPKQRFIEAVNIFENHVAEEFGSTDALKAQIPTLTPDRARVFLGRLLNRLINETLEGLWFTRDGEVYLIVSAGYAGLLRGVDEVADLDEEQSQIVFSSWLAYFARLYSIARGDEVNEDDRAELVRDVARTIYHVERAVDGEASFVDDPESADESLLRDRIKKFGAVLAYSRLNISVGRGAELAGVSRWEFEDLLDRFDVAPRYGPDSASDLYDSDSLADD